MTTEIVEDDEDENDLEACMEVTNTSIEHRQRYPDHIKLEAYHLFRGMHYTANSVCQAITTKYQLDPPLKIWTVQGWVRDPKLTKKYVASVFGAGLKETVGAKAALITDRFLSRALESNLKNEKPSDLMKAAESAVRIVKALSTSDNNAELHVSSIIEDTQKKLTDISDRKRELLEAIKQQIGMDVDLDELFNNS